MIWNELIRGDLDTILDWAAQQPWAIAMGKCQQDAQWHAEGDVWTHTLMVCRQLPQLEQWGDLTHDEQMVLLFTSLFHDSAKPQTSFLDEETGHIRSPKHAVLGEYLARDVLRELNCPIEVREEIARLVRFHGRPAFLLEKQNPAHEIIQLSWLVRHRLLYMFAIADTRGRTTDSTSKPEETLQYWRLVAEENGCFDQPYSFHNDHSRFLFYRQTTPDPTYQAFENHRCTVTMMSGLPGSGKDTWLAKHRSALPVVSLDNIRVNLDVDPEDNQGTVVQHAKESCREYLRTRTSFAWNATNLQRQTRQKWIDLFASYDARIEIVYIEPQFSTILQRNQKRAQRLPEKAIRHMASKCEPPTWTEAHRVLFIDS